MKLELRTGEKLNRSDPGSLLSLHPLLSWYLIDDGESETMEIIFKHLSISARLTVILAGDNG
jgi:hypothetical protein